MARLLGVVVYRLMIGVVILIGMPVALVMTIGRLLFAAVRWAELQAVFRGDAAARDKDDWRNS